MSSYKYPKIENNDCSVISLSIAAGIPYEEAHRIHRKNGREDYCGTKFKELISSYKEAGFTVNKIFGTTKSAKYLSSARSGYSSDMSPALFNTSRVQKGCTLGKFAKEHPKGRFIVLVARHALVVADGSILDNCRTPLLKRVFCSFSAE